MTQPGSRPDLNRKSSVLTVDAGEGRMRSDLSVDEVMQERDNPTEKVRDPSMG